MPAAYHCTYHLQTAASRKRDCPFLYANHWYRDIRGLIVFTAIFLNWPTIEFKRRVRLHSHTFVWPLFFDISISRRWCTRIFSKLIILNARTTSFWKNRSQITLYYYVFSFKFRVIGRLVYQSKYNKSASINVSLPLSTYEARCARRQPRGQENLNGPDPP